MHAHVYSIQICILEEVINYDEIVLFDWKRWKGTFVAAHARQVQVQLESLLSNNTFPREDLKELLTLVLVWLGVKVDNFKFLYPGALSHARFLMQSIYSMKIFLLSSQLSDIYSAVELEQIKDVSTFVGLFHASWYFSGPVASHAPLLHLHTISQMKRVKKFMPEVAETVLDSISLHLWYIFPMCIPLALVDETLTNDQRGLIAVRLLKTPRPAKFALGKPSFPDLSSFSARSWLAGRLPELSTFLGPESWLIFDKLGLSDEDMDWLQHDSGQWECAGGYRRFRDFVKKLTIVNDPAQRGVGLVKQFINTFQNEASCQDNLLAVSKHRKTVQKNSNKSILAKVGLNKIIHKFVTTILL